MLPQPRGFPGRGSWPANKQKPTDSPVPTVGRNPVPLPALELSPGESSHTKENIPRGLQTASPTGVHESLPRAAA